MITVETTGRTDVSDYFEQSGIREFSKLNHTPFVVFVVADDRVVVRCIPNAKELLTLPDQVPVMAQWRGEWRSDFFQFTVGQLREHCLAHPRTYGLV